MRGQLGSCAERSCWPEPHVPVWTCLWRSRPRVGWSVRASEPWAGLGGVPALLGARSAGMSVLLELSPPGVPQGLYSSVACPGTMLTSMTYGILPAFVWTLLMPIIWLVSAGHFCSRFT